MRNNFEFIGKNLSDILMEVFKKNHRIIRYADLFNFIEVNYFEKYKGTPQDLNRYLLDIINRNSNIKVITRNHILYVIMRLEHESDSEFSERMTVLKQNLEP